MKLIPLSQNKFAQIDDDLFDYLSQWKWFFDGDYAKRHIYEYKNGKKIQKNIQMHRLVNKTPKGKFTDHIDGNPLNNQRANLRTCTIRQNGANMKKQPNKSSIYKGVSKDGNIYRTVIWKNNEKVFAASSRNERWAAMIYDLNAAPLFGEFARLNFPEAILVVRE